MTRTVKFWIISYEWRDLKRNKRWKLGWETRNTEFQAKKAMEIKGKKFVNLVNEQVETRNWQCNAIMLTLEKGLCNDN